VIYREKETYLRHKPEGMQRFSSTGIIHLVNICWPNTLGNSASAKRTLLERGWTILYYCLLDNPRVLDNPDLIRIDIHTITVNNQQESFVGLLESIKPLSEQYYITLDKLFNDCLKSDGRKRKYKDLLKKTATKAQKIHHLEKCYLYYLYSSPATTSFAWTRTSAIRC
jgi:hypothetical protein